MTTGARELPDTQLKPTSDPLFDGPGELRALCRDFEWSATPLGPSRNWSAPLRTAVRLMLDSPVATCLWVGTEYILVYNDAYRNILQVKHPGALGTSGSEVWDEIWPGVWQQFEKVRTERGSVFFTDTLLRMERLEDHRAEDAYFTYMLSPLTGESGEHIAVYNVAIEVTEAMRDKAMRGEFAETVEQATDFVGIADLDGNARYVNPAGRGLIGLGDLAAVRKTRVIDYFAPDWKSRVETEILPHLLSGGSWRGEVMFRHFDNGEIIPAEWNVFPVKDQASGEIRALACVARDLREQYMLNAERLRLLQEAQMARSEAESASRAKSDFLAVMSHELRTPLNAIGGYAELLAMGIRGPVTNDQMEDLHRIQSSQRHLLGLINEVLNHARLETGAVQYEIIDVWLGDSFAVAEGLLAPQARMKGITLSIGDCPDHMKVKADSDKLQQILLNLLSNAVKFTERGGSITINCEKSDDNVVIRVRDTGIGVPADKLESIFDPFVQVDSKLNRNAEGTGLGLSISRDLARGMGGDLTVESSLGAGSTFSLVLPGA